jgi:hypothetical protein
MSRLLPSLVALAVLGPLAQPAGAQLYRWVDERGVVNYGDTPPANARQVTPLNPDKSGVSVVPGLSRDELDRARKSAEQARIERLEREVKSLREEARSRPSPAPPVASEPTTVYVPVYEGPLRPPRPWPPKPPKPQPIEPPPPPPPPLFTRPR